MFESEDVKRIEVVQGSFSFVRDTHPAFGQVVVTRVSGQGQGNGGRMFGSAVDDNPERISIRIFRASFDHDLCRDRIHSDTHPVVEVEMTPLQFAEMIKSIGIGSGTPCTFRYADGKSVPFIAGNHESEIRKIRRAFEEKMESAKQAKMVDERRKELDDVLDGVKIPKAARSKLVSMFESLLVSSENDAGFALGSFIESAEKVENEVKREIEARVSSVIHNAGIAALKGVSVSELKELEDVKK